MDDLISRQDAIDANCEDWCGCKHKDCQHKSEENKYCDGCDTVGVLKDLPSAQPERETAKFIRWMECKKTAYYISYTPHCKCSKCGNELLIEAINYCYICGARMEGRR